MAGLFDGMPAAAGGLFGNVNQQLTPFAQRNQMALINAGLGLMGGSTQDALRGFAAGGAIDAANRRTALQDEILRGRAAREQTLFNQQQQDRRTAAERLNATQAAAVGMGLDQGIAQGMSGPALTQWMLQQQAPAAAPDPTTSMREYNFAVSQGFPGRFTDYQQMQDLAGAGQYARYDPQAGGLVMGDVPGSQQQREREQERARAQAQAQEMLDVIEGVENAPGLSDVVGAPNVLTNPPFIGPIPGTNAADFQARVDQLQGKAFLQAFESLKGGGQITEREGIAAQNAIARLQTSQSEAAFRQALTDLKTVVRSALRRAQTGSTGPTGDGWQTLPNGTRIREKQP